jgi:hypothetical protein
VTRRNHQFNAGSMLTMTLVFLLMFVVIFTALAGLVSRSYHESVLQAQDETAFQVAEAGLNFARWRLAHNPEDFSAVTRDLTDQFAGVLGSYDLTFEQPIPGSTIVSITAVGRTASQPARRVTLSARYGQPSLARYASITNGDAWYGGPIQGAVHANGGIRMDGSSDSLMTSERETYPCQPNHGCSSPFENKPGIWGTGVKAELWEFPVTRIDYNALTVDLLAMKEAAIESDTYYGPIAQPGYQIVFNTNNTYTISRVNTKGPLVQSCMYQPTWQCENSSYDVNGTTVLETKAVPSNGVIFVEDTVWVRGAIRDRITLAAGVFPDQTATNVDIITNGSIEYGGLHDGSRVFAAVAQRHILIPWSSVPDAMVLEGAYVAQKGSFHRRYYPNNPHRVKTSLARFGMIASNGIPTTAWLNSGVVVSGFQTGSATYDSHLLYGPPPYFPTSGQYEFISWEEQQ